MKWIKTIFSSDYGMLGVLILLCAFFSWITFEEQQPEGEIGAEQLSQSIAGKFTEPGRVLIAGRKTDSGKAFTSRLNELLLSNGWNVTGVVQGGPIELGKGLRAGLDGNNSIDLLACEQYFVQLAVLENFRDAQTGNSKFQVMAPQSSHWPNFLKTSNLLNVANQIAVIAILAIGMTLVIITAGIDLSVGSLIAVSAVLATWIIRECFGGDESTIAGMVTGCGLAILACSALGFFSGSMIAFFGVPPFVATLGMMMVGSGLAYMLSGGLSVYQLPESFDWLGRGDDFAGIPNAVILMVFLYLLAHIVMSRTTVGRYIYAVGGNPEAARLSGVPVKKILLWVYAGCGALAGLGGVIMASQFKSGDPKYGLMYELYVIAAVVVGGTSLSGGRGKVFGTLIGAFIIAVIQNGMNLTGVQSYTQKVVLGVVLLLAVLLDMLKKRGWKLSA
ncbi:MAG: ABC transporter permease [Opitutae bacterium]|nr:ABC transporter permease [Opitutae bacterium]